MPREGSRRARPLCTIAASLAFLPAAAPSGVARAEPAPMRLAIVGLEHGHVHGFLDRLKGRPDVQLAAIADPDSSLLARYRDHYGLARSEEHTSELQSRPHLVCRLLLE